MSQITKQFIEVDEALQIIRSLTFSEQKTETVSARDSLNCILAEDLTAKRDIPKYDNSAMDGFVMRKSDLDSGIRSFPVAFEVRPENPEPESVPKGSCAQIMTGAPIPPGTDFVIPVELSEMDGDNVLIKEVPERNAVRKQGEGYRNDSVLLKKGAVIRPYETGLIIESGNENVKIRKPLRIALQVTGSEIDESNNTNGPVLYQLANKWPGTVVTEYPVLGDNPEDVTARLNKLKKSSDLIMTTGGISAGKHDYLFAELNRLGAKCLIRKINQKPGKPFTLFHWDDTIVCCLPGNPVSSVFTAEYYARRIVSYINGLEEPEEIGASASAVLNNPSSKTLFVPGRISFNNGKITVEADARMRSHLMQLYSGCNVYVRLEPESEIAEGESVSCLQFTSALQVS